ncbi:hypothetical protein QQ045_018134 [Rhodiola kirilowii]
MYEKGSDPDLLICINGYQYRALREYYFLLYEGEAANKPDDFINTTLQALKKASPSPTSLKISLRFWAPSKLELVSDEMVEKYFTKVPELNWEDLKFPARPQIPSSFSKL